MCRRRVPAPSNLEHDSCDLTVAEEYKRLKTLIVGGKTGAMKNMPRNMQKGMAGMNPHDMKNQLAQMSKIIPPHILKQMGGTAGLQGFMKQMGDKM